MLNISDVIIYGELGEILETLQKELALRGLNRFQQLKEGVDNIQTTCPFHKGGQEKKPSFGINKTTGKAHCFTCGWSGDLTTLISQLFGRNDGGKFGKNWLLKRYNSIQVESRPNVLQTFTWRTRTELQKELPYITEEELDKYRYIHPYMYERGLTDEIIERFDIGYDKERKEITFPVADMHGTVRFIARRSVESKFFRLPKGLDKPLYQGYRFVDGEYRTAYITESFLNCLTCWKYGKPAIALIGTGNSRQYEMLENLPVREYILAFDPDDAGRKATERFKKNVKNKIIKELQYEEEGKDINDLQQDFLNLNIIF